MKKGNYVLAIALALIAIIAVIILLQWRASVDTPPVTIPSPAVSDEGSSAANQNTPLEVTAKTVQQLIASITRPDAYSRKYKVRIFWEGGQSESEIAAYCKNDQFLITDTRTGRSTLFASGKVNYWYNNARPITTVDIKDINIGTLDLSASLLIYENLLTIPAENIITAADEVYLDESCIYVEYKHSELYTYRLHISVEKGLLVGAEALENGKTVYELETISTDMSAPADEIFALPTR